MAAFSVFKDKRAKRGKAETPTVEAHYTKLARRTALIRYICLALVTLFAVYSFSFHSNEITIENFEYMLKFLNTDEEEDAPKNTVIAFDGNEGNRGIIYKGDLAVLNEGGLTITGWDGDVLHKNSFTFDHPKMVENGINLFCYDLGGKDLKVFNSYSQVWTPETPFEYPIYWLAASESGGFAVASSAKSYRSAVYVYDSAFRIIYSRLFGDKYVNFVDISPDGKEFITAGYYSENGNLVTVISKFRIDSEEILFSETFIGEMPLGIYYTDSGYSLLTTDNMTVYNSQNEITATVSFAGRELISGRIFGERLLVTYGLEGLSGGTEAVVYGSDGNILFKKEFKTSLSDAMICGDTLYTLAPGEFTVCSVSGGSYEEYSVPTAYSSLVADGDKPILFSENQAEYFNTNTFEKKENGVELDS